MRIAGDVRTGLDLHEGGGLKFSSTSRRALQTTRGWDYTCKVKEGYLETSSPQQHIPLEYLDNERKKYIHCIKCSLNLSSVGACSLKAGALINPSYINSTVLFPLPLPRSSYFFPLKKIINKLVLLHKGISTLARQTGPGVGRLYLGTFSFLSMHFEIRWRSFQFTGNANFSPITFQSHILCG